MGLAAGLDKTAAHIDALGSLGFGFIEAGTVTPRPQAGNAKPRMFRLIGSQALINRMGFNNEGADQFVANVHRQRTFRDRGGIVGLNIGKNADTPIEHALEDYRTCLRRVYDDADYVAVNVSSPNTKELRSLQSARQLDGLLTGLTEERKRLEDRHGKASADRGQNRSGPGRFIGAANRRPAGRTSNGRGDRNQHDDRARQGERH